MTSKTEKATPFKLQKAKEKGQVSKSIELNTSLFFLVMVLVGSMLGPSTLKQLLALMTHLLYLAPRFSWDLLTFSKLEHFLLSTLINLWFAFGLAAALSHSLITIAQTGFIFSLHPLKPMWKRLNFVEGFKRLFTSKIFFETAKTALKLGLFFSLMLVSLHHEIPGLLKLMSLTPHEHPALIRQLYLKIILQLLTLLFALAVLDKLYSSWKFQREQRMSKQELKDEYRQREGEPKIKAKIKQLQYQLRQKTKALEQVKTADVVITNPNHLAIALKYERTSMPSPKVVCKAQGKLVNQVKSLAKRHQIPIVENKTFARALFANIDLNQSISEEFFPVAANIYREIYRDLESHS